MNGEKENKTEFLQWLLKQYIECQRVGTMTDKRNKEIPTKNSERFIVDIGMGNSTSSGQPVYTMDNSQFNMLYHLQIIEKYLTEKLGHCVDPIDYVTTIERGIEIIRDFSCIFMGDDAVLAFCRTQYPDFAAFVKKSFPNAQFVATTKPLSYAAILKWQIQLVSKILMISKKMGYDLNGEGFTREDAKACVNLLSTPNVNCEGFDNDVTITPAEKVLSVIFSLKYMPNASHGDSLMKLLNHVKNKAIKQDYQQLLKIIQQQSWMNRLMTVGQITDVIDDSELPEIPLDPSVMVNIARVFDNFQDKANFIKQESGLVDIKHHKDYHVTDNFHGTAVLIRRFDPLKAGEVLKLHNEFYSGLTFLDRHYLTCSYLYNTHGCRSHYLLFMMNRYFEQHSVIAYSDQDL